MGGHTNSSNACKSPQCNRDVDNSKRGFHPEGFDDEQRLCCILGDFNLNSVTFGHFKQLHASIFDNELKHVKILFSLYLVCKTQHGPSSKSPEWKRLFCERFQFQVFVALLL